MNQSIEAKKAFIKSLTLNLNEFVGHNNYTYDPNTHLIHLHTPDQDFYTLLTTAFYTALSSMDIYFEMVTLELMGDLVTQEYYIPIIEYDKVLKSITLKIMLNQSGFHYFDVSVLISLFTDVQTKVEEYKAIVNT